MKKLRTVRVSDECYQTLRSLAWDANASISDTCDRAVLALAGGSWRPRREDIASPSQMKHWRTADGKLMSRLYRSGT